MELHLVIALPVNFCFFFDGSVTVALVAWTSFLFGFCVQ